MEKIFLKDGNFLVVLIIQKQADFFILAGEKYKQLTIYQNSIDSFDEAIGCLIKLQNNIRIAHCYIKKTDIYFLNSEYEKCISCLQSAVMYYIKEKNYIMGIKTYIEYINNFIKENNLEIAENILLKCLNDCENNIDNTFFQIYGDVVFSKYLNILCWNKKNEEAIKMNRKSYKN